MVVATADTVKQLRERTGAGMMDCKAALIECGGDIEKAIDSLRKKGMAQAAKRAGREAKEGLIVARIEGKKAAIAEVNCETDFVARTEDFKQFGAMVLSETLTGGDGAASCPKVSQRVAELSGKIGEKIQARRSRLLGVSDGLFFTYMHSNNKLGVIVELACKNSQNAQSPTLAELGKHLAMQVAASNPLCIRRQEVPAAAVEREKAIYREEIKGKPENIVEKIMQGKLEKFYQAGCLIEQVYVKNDKQTVKQLIDETSKALGDSIEIRQFVRWQLGEAIASNQL